MARSDARLILANQGFDPFGKFQEGRDNRTRNKLLDLASQQKQQEIDVTEEVRGLAHEDRQRAEAERIAQQEQAQNAARAKDFVAQTVKLKTLFENKDMPGVVRQLQENKARYQQMGLPTETTDLRIALLENGNEGAFLSQLQGDLAEAQQFGYFDPGELHKLGKDDSLVDQYGRRVAQGVGESPDEVQRQQQERLDKEKADQERKIKENLQTEEGLRKEVNSLLGDFNKVSDAYARIQASAKDASPAGDLALVFNYMKMLDPGSTVRESEFAAAANAGSLAEAVKNKFGKVFSGEILEFTRDDFISRSAELFDAALQEATKTADAYEGIAKRNGVSVENVLANFNTRNPVAGGGKGGGNDGEEPKEGDIVVNKKTGERKQLRNGQWVVI